MPPTPATARGRASRPIEELAHQITAVHALADPAAGIRTNVGQVGGGTGDNVVAGEAWARIDARAWKADEQRSLERSLHALRPHLDGAVLTVTGGITRPPMMQTPAGRRARAQRDRDRGDVRHQAGRERLAGRSDGNFAAAVGTPVIDGLGPTGTGAHALDERVSLESIEERTGLLAALLAHL